MTQLSPEDLQQLVRNQRQEESEQKRHPESQVDRVYLICAAIFIAAIVLGRVINNGLWVVAGVAFLVGLVVFVYRRYFKRWPTSN